MRRLHAPCVRAAPRLADPCALHRPGHRVGPAVLGVPLFTAGFYFCLPFFCLKQLISVVQLVEASCVLAAYKEDKRN